jgi:aspartate aminotransferase-like enzyme
MEATITNLVEPGETIVVGNNGIWGARVCDMAARYGGPSCLGPPCKKHRALAADACVLHESKEASQWAKLELHVVSD